jgi:trehalose 6-phosphate synthase/phosphatase
LHRLSQLPNYHVHIVSGRGRDNLEQWLGSLPIGLHAEHGFWSRFVGEQHWHPFSSSGTDWKAQVRPILEETARRTAGSLVEEKATALAWHYRTADPELANDRLRGLRTQLTTLLEHHSLEMLSGSKVVEIRMKGVHKGVVVPRILEMSPPGCAILAIGDDKTDEDLFRKLPPSATTIHVGTGVTSAKYSISSHKEVRRILLSLLLGRVPKISVCFGTTRVPIFLLVMTGTVPLFSPSAEEVPPSLAWEQHIVEAREPGHSARQR